MDLFFFFSYVRFGCFGSLGFHYGFRGVEVLDGPGTEALLSEHGLLAARKFLDLRQTVFGIDLVE